MKIMPLISYSFVHKQIKMIEDSNRWKKILICYLICKLIQE